MQGIYSITNTVNNKRYIGMSVDVEKRWIKHRSKLNNNVHHSAKLQNAWNKYGKNAFIFDLLYCVDDRHTPALAATEKYFIKLYDSHNHGYNCSDGGESFPNFTVPEETRRKISESEKGKVVSAESRKKMSEANKGKIISEEVKAKISDALKGKEFSEETRKKIADSKRGRFYSEETRRKIGEASRGRIFNAKTRKRLSEISSGENNQFSKVTTSQAIDMRMRYLKKEQPKYIIKDYPFLDDHTVRRICTGRAWKHIPNTIVELEKYRDNCFK